MWQTVIASNASSAFPMLTWKLIQYIYTFELKLALVKNNRHTSEFSQEFFATISKELIVFALHQSLEPYVITLQLSIYIHSTLHQFASKQQPPTHHLPTMHLLNPHVALIL